MKIIIVGAGISGLCTYLLLKNRLPDSDAHTIVVYEAHDPRKKNGLSELFQSPLSSSEAALKISDTAAVVGNILSLAPASLKLLKWIDERLYTVVKERAYINHNYTFRTARGHTLAITPTGDGLDPSEYTVSCSRYALWQWCQEVVGAENIQYRRVSRADLSGSRPVVYFADGTKDEADLVIGADGTRSTIKKAVLEGEEVGDFEAQYEGFAGVGSFENMPIPASVTDHRSMVFTFGPTGSFGYCSAAPTSKRVLSWWSNWGMASIPNCNFVDPEEIRRQLQERHGNWEDPVIREIIKEMKTDRIYPVWTTPDLPYWGRNGAILLGDAAHALRAMSGQGAGQAIEDSVTFYLLLSHYLSTLEKPGTLLAVRDAVNKTAAGLYRIRQPRVSMAKKKARRMYFTKKRLNNILVELLYYCFIFICVRFGTIGQIVIGTIFRADEWDCTTEVEKFLATEGLSG